MKIPLILTMLCLLKSACFAADIPHGVGGFLLGGSIEQFKEMIEPETAMPVRYQEYLNEVEIKENPYFKSGLIAYGACADPGKIVRIKLKYADGSRRMYEQLLKRMTERFGEPGQWRGDPFQILLAWKWSFKDSQGNTISLILQHNTKDQEEKIGTAVKMTLTNQLEREMQCHEKHHPDIVDPKPTRGGIEKKPVSPDWRMMLPH